MKNASCPPSELPKGWVSIALGSLGAWRGGGTPSKLRPEFWASGKLPWVSPKDMKTEQIADSTDHITAKAVDESATNLIPADSVLVVTRSGILRHTLPVAVNTTPVTINQDLKALTPHEGVSAYFVAWSLRHLNQTILQHCSKGGTTVNSVEFPLLRSLEILLPPLAEQHRIVAKIEELFSDLDAGVEALKKTKALLKRYRQSVLKAAFEGKLTAKWRKANKGKLEPASVLLERISEERKKAGGKVKELPPVDAADLPELPEGWAWARVGDIARLVQYGTSEKTGDGPAGIPVIRMGNIQDGELDFANLKYLPPNTEGIADLILSEGDILFNRTNSAELVGKTATYRSQHPKASFASYLIRIRLVPDSLNPFLLSRFINSWQGRLYIASVVSQQVGQANVNGTKLTAMSVPVPPVPEQEQLLAEIERRFTIADQVEKIVEQSLKQSQRLRQSILKRAFSGRLVTQDPKDEPAAKLLERIKEARTNTTTTKPRRSHPKES